MFTKLQSVLRVLLAVLALFGCGWLTVRSVRTGYSRLLSTAAIIQYDVEPADRAVGYAPGDPEAHYTRALSLVNAKRLNEAVAELKTSTQLRPRYYYEWLDLGVTLDRLGNESGALDALNESVRLAPAFSQPRWQLGNALFRESKYDEAFVQMRMAVRNNSDLVNELLALGWVASEGDVSAFDALIQPQSKTDHLEMARFLASQGEGSAAAMHAEAINTLDSSEQRELLNQTVRTLLAANQFLDAFRVWSVGHPSETQGTPEPTGRLRNGNFTEPIVKNDPGFGWQLGSEGTVGASIYPSGPAPGTRSLVLDFNGGSPMGTPLFSQILLVKPKTRYLLVFKARTENLVSGGPPLLKVADLGRNGATTLGESRPIGEPNVNWTAYQVDFTTKEDAQAVNVQLERRPCSEVPCPIFGKLALSQFAITSP